MSMSVKDIERIKEELRSWDLVDLKKKLGSLSSRKCRLKKIERKKVEMLDVLENERIVREVINEKSEKKLSIYERDREDINCMSYEEVMKGIKNVDSIKCIELSKDNVNDEKLDKLEKVRVWLVDRKKEVEGSSRGMIRISDIVRKLEDIKNVEELKEWLLCK